MDRVYHEFPPFYEKDAKVLLLGSFPSVKSREQQFYYAHPANLFFPVLSAVYEEEVPLTVEERKAFLSRHHLALWDVIESCTITGSRDDSIRDVKANDIRSLLQETSIRAIFTTGKKAYQLYEKYCEETVGQKAFPLPSTSPLNRANYSFDELVQCYKQVKEEEEKDGSETDSGTAPFVV